MQASLLSATFYGSLLTIAISGSMADRFGQKLILIGACMVYVIVTLATPLLAELSFNALFAARLIMGLAEVAVRLRLIVGLFNSGVCESLSRFDGRSMVSSARKIHADWYLHYGKSVGYILFISYLSFTLLIVFWLAIDLLLFRYSWRNVDCFLVPPILKFDRYQSIRTGSRNEVFGVGNLEKRGECS
ncbi:hypothetical protein PRIPAC_76758 [Pristionchus pacificus]|nr:hypothetical protein PRIPAC_76758 [Pristionchus pacificus]